MLCTRMPQTTDLAVAARIQKAEEGLAALKKRIASHEAARYAPDGDGQPNATCKGCFGETMPVSFITSMPVIKRVRTVYCRACEPGLKGHPAESYVYL